jgi:hypothetical protein
MKYCLGSGSEAGERRSCTRISQPEDKGTVEARQNPPSGHMKIIRQGLERISLLVPCFADGR